MPNYCRNKFAIIASSKKELDDVVDFIKGDNGDFDFNKIVPMPEDLDIEVVGCNASEEVQAKYQSNIEKYGYKDWYDWRCDKWGCKWNAEIISVLVSEGELGIMIDFYTPWAPPIPIYEALSKKFPNLKMWYLYAECGVGIYGSGFKDFDDDLYYATFEDGSEQAWLLLDFLGFDVTKDANGNWCWNNEEEEE